MRTNFAAVPCLLTRHRRSRPNLPAYPLTLRESMVDASLLFYVVLLVLGVYCLINRADPFDIGA